MASPSANVLVVSSTRLPACRERYAAGAACDCMPITSTDERTASADMCVRGHDLRGAGTAAPASDGQGYDGCGGVDWRARQGWRSPMTQVPLP